VAALPFATADFLAVFARYNAAIWPGQIAAYLLGAIAVAAALRPSRLGDRVAAGALVAMWLANGIGYHALFFAAINPAAIGFAAIFMVEAALIAWLGLARGRLRFAWKSDAAAFAGVVTMAYAAIVYPLLGLASGHTYPAAPIFGTAPCPTTIFTFGMFLLARAPFPKALLVVPALWAVIGTGAAVSLGMTEDYAQPLAAILACVLILRRDRAASARR
jgi:Family of unknown function (DUF6064)